MKMEKRILNDDQISEMLEGEKTMKRKYFPHEVFTMRELESESKCDLCNDNWDLTKTNETTKKFFKVKYQIISHEVKNLEGMLLCQQCAKAEGYL
jgi:hypothetical protein